MIRERFAKAVARGVQELRIKRATSTPIAGLIENAVMEVSTTAWSCLWIMNYES